MRILIGLGLCAALLAGCTSSEDRLFFDGQLYNAKLRKVDRQLDQFQITVRPVSKSLLGAREAGRYEATSYCINLLGSSDITWTEGPDVEEGALTIDKDTLVLQGRCRDAR